MMALAISVLIPVAFVIAIFVFMFLLEVVFPEERSGPVVVQRVEHDQVKGVLSAAFGVDPDTIRLGVRAGKVEAEILDRRVG